MATFYDTIGHRYGQQRRPDPLIAAAIAAAIGSGTVLNVGAGTGSYEPRDVAGVAVEPSARMIAQRAMGTAPAVRAIAEMLPFPDRSFDVTLAVLTVHHWTDQRRGLKECARVARDRVVIFTWDPASPGFWLVQDYLPEILALDRSIFPGLDVIAGALGELDVRVVPIPGDCIDGFLGAYWRRPDAYLDPAVRAGISSFSRISDPTPALARLREDLRSGAWARRHAHLAQRADFDLGYRLLIAHRSGSP